MQAIYYFDKNTKEFTGSDIIAGNATIPDNATTIQPINDDGSGMYDPTWNGYKWIGLTKEDYDKKHKNDTQPDVPAPAPTPEQLMINQLGLRVAKLEQSQSKEGA